MSDEVIEIVGAREPNPKGIHVILPERRLLVLSGLGGARKSRLAFDTLFAEGRRRYVESLSVYLRQFLGQLDKPRYDAMRGLTPTIAAERNGASSSPRSTVGPSPRSTITSGFSSPAPVTSFVIVEELTVPDVRTCLTSVTMVYAGVRVLILQKGTCWTTDEVRPLKKSEVVLAIGPQLPILPIAVAGSFDLLPKGARVAKPGRVAVAVSRPTSTEGLTNEDRDRLISKAEAAIRSVYEEAQSRLCR